MRQRKLKKKELLLSDIDVATAHFCVFLRNGNQFNKQTYDDWIKDKQL